MKSLLFIFCLVLLSSCGMNFLFLHPFELNDNSEFKQFKEDAGDTLKLTFENNARPNFEFLGESTYDPGYKINSTFFEGAKGNRLNAWIITPDDEGNGTSLFFLHGNAGNIVYNYQLAIPFVERGYKVFLMDYSEFGFSEGKAKRKVILEDALKGFDFMKSRYEFEDEKIVIYGQSLGGHLAAVVGTKKQNEIDALVVEGAFANHKDIAADRVPFLGRIFVAEQYSGTKHLPEYNKPLLVIHSISDATVPISQGRKLYESANEPKSFYQIDSMHVRGPLYYADSISFKIQSMLGQ